MPVPSKFVPVARTIKPGTWSPATTPEVQRKSLEDSVKEVTDQNKRVDQSEAPAPIWTPKSAPSSPTAQRKFKPVNFKSPTLSRKAGNVSRNAENSTVTKPPTPRSLPVSPSPSQSNVIPPPTPPPSLSTPDSPVQSRSGPISRSSSSELTSTQTLSQTLHSSTSQKSQQSTSQHTSSSYSSSSIPRPSVSPHLPKSQNPTITLLQKAREGQLPKGASYLESNMPEQQQKDQNDNNIDSINETKSKPRKAAGVGPIIQEGVPTSLRSEVDEENKEKWYKKMYDSLHKFGSDQDYVTVRYKTKRKEDGHHGYSSEPEGVTGNKYATLDRRRVARSNKENEFVSAVNNVDNISYQNSIKHAMEIYKNQPGRIENYQPGHSSISEKEAKQWWDDMMDIFDEQMEQGKGRTIPTVVNSPTSRHPFMTYALKESGYESDSTLVFKKRDENQREHLSPTEQKIAYKVIQQGGEVPLHGLRKAAPEKPKDPAGPKVASVPVREYQSLSPGTLCPESPHKYVDSEVTLQYRRPVRNEIKELISEEELARRQAEAMRRIYQEERRRKYLQELHDISSRRHTDNFTPSQKSPIPLNRYDDYNYEDSSRPQSRTRDRTPEPKLVARALYNFVGQTSKELSFKKGDIIFVRRQVDKNWYEGEHNAMIGLFPFNYVEIIPYDKIRTAPKKLSEGQARAKFNFVAQTHLELSLVKGELVTLTRRVDNNWFEGRIGNRRGIFPVTYVEVLVEPGERAASPMSQGTLSSSSKPVAAPAAHSLIHNGAPSQHSYQPNSFTSVQQSRDSKSHVSSTPVGGGAPMDQTLHIDTHSDPVPYRALYSYKPQNDDELELREGETVFVMEKCDDGWYVGSSQRSGCFGTFPGNYVERAS
uniref:Sorbin and SH3 domain-containing protein 1 n=1 Tax=Cacopsylla melanoneura TaxID=428564 RepID=A0A8D8XUG2_9HEMI